MNNRYLYLISSNVDYELSFLFDCIKSLVGCGITFDNLAGFIGKKPINEKHGIYYDVTHNSFDMTALIAYIENYNDFKDFEQVFLLHDSTIAGPNFKKIIESYYTDDYMSISGIMTMGLFHPSFILQQREHILSLKNCNKDAACANEVYFFNKTGKVFFRDYEDPYIKGDIITLYRNIQRRMVYFRNVDLYKYTVNLN